MKLSLILKLRFHLVGFIAFAMVVVALGFWFIKQNPRNATLEESAHLKFCHGSYFFLVSISGFNEANIPCFSIKVGDQTASAKLDLGFRGNVNCSQAFLENIDDKQFLRTKKMYGFRGSSSEVQVFLIPPVQIGKMIFSDLNCYAEEVEFRKNGSMYKGEEEVSSSEAVAVGWHLFRSVNLFLDLKNSKIAFCDSLATLRKEGYPVDTFVKSELFTEHGFLECNIALPEGLLRCALDTGSTLNILHKELTAGQSVEEMAWDPENLRHVSSFKIGEVDFGSIDFHYLPIQLPVPIMAFLGMEFFSKHMVFIDFAENCVYIAPA